MIRINTSEGQATREKLIRARKILMANAVAAVLFVAGVSGMFWILEKWIHPR